MSDWLLVSHIFLVLTPSKATVVSLSKKLYLHCLVLVGSRKGYKIDFSMEIEGFIEIDIYVN